VSDADLRALERRFRETGSVEDEAAWLIALVQAGEVEQSRLESAAALSHPAALVATLRQPLELTTVSGLVDQVDGDEAQIRSALAALRTSWVAWETVWRGYPPGVKAFMSRLNAIEDWVVCPCDDHQLRVERALGARVFIALEHVLMRAGEVDEGLIELGEGIVLGWSDERASACLSYAAAGVNGPAFGSQVLEPTKSELVPWLLGYGDPVRERVEARQRVETVNE